MENSSFQKFFLIFSRYPRLGKVKTRLESNLTTKYCLELHTALLLDTLDRLSSLDAACHLFISDSSEDELLHLAQKFHFPKTIQLHCQKGTNLGERMWNAYQEISNVSSVAVFFGTDTPNLPLEYIRKVFKKLDKNQVIIGPAEDGGYYLIALSEDRRELFQDIDWGTSTVLTQTCSKLSSHEYSLLPPWYDIDNIQDLERLKNDLKIDCEGFPRRTHSFLKKIQL